MAKGKLHFIGLAAATITLSACVVKIWEVNIPGPEGGYSGAHDLTLTSDNEPVLVGFTDRVDTNEQSVIVAKYDTGGNQLWMHEASGLRQAGMPQGNSFVTTDSNDAVIFAGFTLDEPAMLVKLNADGTLAWQVGVGSHYSIPLDVKTINDELILLAEISGRGNSLHAYSGSGIHLWSYPEHEICVGTGCEPELDDYPAITPPPAFSSTEIAIAAKNEIIFNNGHTLTKMNTAGEIISQVSVVSLGLNGMPDIAVNEQQVAVLGDGPQGAEVVILDNNLEVTTRYTTDIQDSFFSMIDIDGSSTVCVAGINGNMLSVQGFGEGIDWLSTTEHNLNFEGITGVSLNERGSCYVSTIEPNEPPEGTVANIPSWSSTTQIYDSSGSITDSISIPHFIGYSVRVEGNIIYSAGQSADYIDGDYPLETNAATLFKHQVR